MKNKYFLQEIYSVCTKYCENRGWRTSVVDMNEHQVDLKGDFEVSGEDVLEP
jgi:peptide chain release factor 1